jgi:hypothetical protein
MIGIRAELGLSNSRIDHKNLPPSKSNEKRDKTPRRLMPPLLPEPGVELLPAGGTPGKNGCGVWLVGTPCAQEAKEEKAALRSVRRRSRREWLTSCAVE